MNKKTKNEIVISSFDGDQTTDLVIEYIRFYSNNLAEVLRYNQENIILNLEINLSNSKESIIINTSQDTKFNIEKNSMWYRRGNFNFNKIWKQTNEKKIFDYISFEEEQVQIFMHNYFTRFSGFHKEKLNNKLLNLHLAKQMGLNIPSTLITTDKSKLLAFYYENDGKIINKPIHHGHIKIPKFEENKLIVSPGTYVVSLEQIIGLPDNFGLSLFQNLIHKEIEIRIFIIDDLIFSMAIFSQNDEQTKIDFRNYNDLKPNRNVPYELPKAIKSKVKKLVKRLNLNSCSIDLILDDNGSYIFLEINPNGQFGWLSKECNYYIEEKIALKCIN